jgi:hypothetical protein
MKHQALFILFCFSILCVKAQVTNAPGRTLHAAAFDEYRKLMLVVGGKKHYKNQSSSQEPTHELLTWDGKKWNTLPGGPPLRDDSKMVYHGVNKKSYLFGGGVGSEAFNDFWEWDGSKWQRLIDNTPVGRRIHTNMVYDAARNRIVLFGGMRKDSLNKSVLENDIWEWRDAQWTKVKPSSDLAPSPRFAFSMVYSSALKKSLIIGGLSATGEPYNEMWTWDGKTFELVSNDDLPLIETGMGNAASLDKGKTVRLILCGRMRESSPANNQSNKNTATFEWNGQNWKALTLLVNPSRRENHTMVTDTNNDQIILFGGGTREEDAFINPEDIWVFKGNEWKTGDRE